MMMHRIVRGKPLAVQHLVKNFAELVSHKENFRNFVFRKHSDNFSFFVIYFTL